MDVSATNETLMRLRTRLAEVQRSGGNPNHAADGRFALGSGKPVPDVLVQNGETGGKYARLIARAEGNEHIHMQCAHCSRMGNGPYAGKRLGVVVRKDGWSHGMCLKCQHDVLLDYYTRLRGMDPDQAERRIALEQAGEPLPEDLLLPVKDSPTAEQRAQRLRILAAQVMQVADQARRAGYPLRNDKGEWIGWVGGDGTVHMNGEGHTHTGWEGVTHHSAHAGKSGGGKSGGTKAQGEATSKSSKSPAEEHPFAAEYRQRLAALRATAEKSGYFAAHPEAEKAHASAEKAARGGNGGKVESPAPYIGADLVPISSAVGYQLNVYGPPEVDTLLKIYGEAQLPKALSLFGTPKLKEAVENKMAEYPGTKPASRTKREDLIAYLVQQATHPGQRNEPATPRGGAKTADQRNKEIATGLDAARRYREASAQREQILKDLEVAKRDHPYDTHFADQFKAEHHLTDAVTDRRQSLATMNKVARSLSQDERDLLRQRLQNHPSYYTAEETAIADLLMAAFSEDTKRIKKSQRAALPDLIALSHQLNGVIADLRRFA
jgi:hypothetical protein